MDNNFSSKQPPVSQIAMAPPSLERLPRACPGLRLMQGGGDQLEAATAYLARKLVFRPYR